MLREGEGIIIQADSSKKFPLANSSVQCCITSPPYWGLRDYGVNGQIGMEVSPEEYIDQMVRVFQQVHRVLKDDGIVWLNLGDSYSGGPRRDEGFNERWHGKAYLSNKQGDTDRTRPKRHKIESLKPKDLVGIPWRVALALQADGWYLRQDIIWHKPNAMPSSVTDRCTTAHEYLFLLAKSQRYYFNHEAIKEDAVSTDNSTRDRDSTKLNNTPGRTKMDGLKTNHYIKRNRRSVWSIPTQGYSEAHFATFPPSLIQPCVRAGSKMGDVVLDPFSGAATTGLVCQREGRKYVGLELNREYIEISQRRLYEDMPLVFHAETSRG